MKAIISSTFDDQYFWFVPIVTWCWNKLGVSVECIIPSEDNARYLDKFDLLIDVEAEKGLRLEIHSFDAPDHKKATYAQCSRLYACALPTIRPSDYLIISDVDMAVFRNLFEGYPIANDGDVDVWGADLVPPGQFPMCYIGGAAETLSSVFNPKNLSMQECLDNLLGGIDCDNMRGNYWAKDQETAYNELTGRMKSGHLFLRNRARPGTQFAQNRIDRDDSFWTDRLNDVVVDAHLWRPGYEDQNLNNLLALLGFMYPNDDHSWIIEYSNKYKSLI
jgi:hypothetical protein